MTKEEPNKRMKLPEAIRELNEILQSSDLDFKRLTKNSPSPQGELGGYAGYENFL